MSIVGGLDIHRKQVTFDYLDTATGELCRGQIVPADREHLAGWLQSRFADRLGDDRAGDDGDRVEFAMEGCTGWRYVAEELARAGARPHLAEPADTAALRGPKRRAKTDRADAAHQRDLLVGQRLPECWIPPAHILEARALLETYHQLRVDHTRWVQRIHAVCFHQGTRALSASRIASGEGLAELEQVARTQLTPAGRQQVDTALAMIAAIDAQLTVVGRQVRDAARHLTGARVLADRLYGVSTVTALALTCWLAGTDQSGAGRFNSARKAVRFAGLDVTVYSSDGKRRPGHLSRQGPEVLRWAIYEAGKTHARSSAPDHGYYASVKDRIDGKRAALAESRRLLRRACHILTELGDQALTIT